MLQENDNEEVAVLCTAWNPESPNHGIALSPSFTNISSPVLDRASSAGRVGLTTPEEAEKKHAVLQSTSLLSTRSHIGLGRSASSTTRATTGRFTSDELNCFRRVPTPSAMNDSVCDAYWLKLGDMRKSLTETGWHSLPVQKGKFYNHSSLKENHRHSPEKGKSRRRVVQTVEQIEQLPQEQDTAQVLDIIFPKTPLSHDVPVASVANGETPHSDSSKCFKSEPAKPIKVSQLKRKSDDSGGQKFYNKGGWCGQIINPASSGSGGSVCASSGALVAGASISLGVDGRYLVNGPTAMLQFRKWLLDKFPTPKDAYDSFANEFPAGRDLTKKEWRRILGRQGFEWLPVADSDAIFEQIDFGHEKRISLRALIMAVEAAAPIRTLQDLRRRLLASGFRS